MHCLTAVGLEPKTVLMYIVLHICLQVDLEIFILVGLGDKCNLEKSCKSRVKEYDMATSGIPCITWPI